MTLRKFLTEVTEKFFTDDKKSLMFSWGIVLSLLGIDLMSTVKVILGANLRSLSVIVMAVAMVCLFGGCKPVFFSRRNRDINLIFLYSIYSIFLAVIALAPVFDSVYGILYQVFYFGQIILLWSNRKLLNIKQLLKILFWVSGCCSAIYFCIVVVNSFSTGSLFFNVLGSDASGHYILTRANAGSSSFITLVTMLAYESDKTGKYKKYENILRCVFGIFGFAVLIFANRRSDILAFGIVILLYLRSLNGTLSKKQKRSITIKVCCAAVVCGIVILCSECLRLMVSHSVKFMINGILTYIGVSNSDIGTSFRANVFATVPHRIIYESNIFQLIFGFGYMTQWLDIPFLQGFYDMGLLGGTFYIVVMGIIPIKYLVRKSSNNCVKFAQYLFCTHIIHNFANGLPYGVFFRLVLLIIMWEIASENEASDSKKKILFVETCLEGHRSVYLKALCGGEYESVALLPQRCEELSCTQYVYSKTDYCVSRSLKNYCTWIKEIKDIAKKENCDIVHFLCGDYLYRYFGLLLCTIKPKTFVTFHHMAFGFFKKISIGLIFSGIDKGIVHTDSLLNTLKSNHIENAVKIEYPCFNFFDDNLTLPDSADAKKALGIPDDRKCLTVLGTLNSYKGTELLLQALNGVKYPFTLCIAGYPRDLSEEKIKEATAGYADSTVLVLHFLSEDEYINTVIASDILVLPYLKVFDGASGPLIDATWYRKPVIGANHGSMGNIISKNQLGITFESESVEKLTEAINKALSEGLFWSDSAEKYRDELLPEKFMLNYISLYNS